MTRNAIRDEWIAVGLSTAPADRPAAEEGIRMVYRASQLGAPSFEWHGSPMAGALAAARGGVSAASLFNVKIIGIKENDLRVPIGKRMAAANLIGCEIVDRAGCIEEKQSPLLFGTKAAYQMQTIVLAAVFGQFEAANCAVLDYGSRTSDKKISDKIAGMMLAARSCGFYWPLKDPPIVIATERPTRIALDDEGLVHREDGPAIEYPDGFAVWAWHGERVPAEAIERPMGIDWGDILGVNDALLKEAVAEAKAHGWAGGDREKFEAALAARRLGGVEAMRDFIESE